MDCYNKIKWAYTYEESPRVTYYYFLHFLDALLDSVAKQKQTIQCFYRVHYKNVINVEDADVLQPPGTAWC